MPRDISAGEAIAMLDHFSEKLPGAGRLSRAIKAWNDQVENSDSRAAAVFASDKAIGTRGRDNKKPPLEQCDAIIHWVNNRLKELDAYCRKLTRSVESPSLPKNELSPSPKALRLQWSDERFPETDLRRREDLWKPDAFVKGTPPTQKPNTDAWNRFYEVVGKLPPYGKTGSRKLLFSYWDFTSASFYTSLPELIRSGIVTQVIFRGVSTDLLKTFRCPHVRDLLKNLQKLPDIFSDVEPHRVCFIPYAGLPPSCSAYVGTDPSEEVEGIIQYMSYPTQMLLNNRENGPPFFALAPDPIIPLNCKGPWGEFAKYHAREVWPKAAADSEGNFIGKTLAEYIGEIQVL